MRNMKLCTKICRSYKNNLKNQESWEKVLVMKVKMQENRQVSNIFKFLVVKQWPKFSKRHSNEEKRKKVRKMKSQNWILKMRWPLLLNPKLLNPNPQQFKNNHHNNLKMLILNKRMRSKRKIKN